MQEDWGDSQAHTKYFNNLASKLLKGEDWEVDIRLQEGGLPLNGCLPFFKPATVDDFKILTVVYHIK